MSMPARRPDPSGQQPLTLWAAADDEPTEPTSAAAADQPSTAQLTLAPGATALPASAAGGSLGEEPAAAEDQVQLSAVAVEADVEVAASPPRPMAVPLRPGRGGLRLGSAFVSPAALPTMAGTATAAAPVAPWLWPELGCEPWRCWRT